MPTLPPPPQRDTTRKQLTISINPDLWAWLQSLAVERRRSIADQGAFMLEQAILDEIEEATGDLEVTIAEPESPSKVAYDGTWLGYAAATPLRTIDGVPYDPADDTATGEGMPEAACERDLKSMTPSELDDWRRS